MLETAGPENAGLIVAVGPVADHRPVLRSAGLLHADLRRRILTLDLLPGAPISEIPIAEEYNVSRTPVREALQRLAGEGLVEIGSKSGNHVARIPLHALSQAIVVRRALEGVTARLAARQGRASQIMELEARLEHMRELLPAAKAEVFHAADEAFHAMIATMAGYPGIWTLVEAAKLHVERFRRIILPQQGRMALIVEEHAAIFRPIAARDEDGAAEAMDAHIGVLEHSPETVRRAHPDFFTSEDR